jgi:hypothetical protein
MQRCWRDRPRAGFIYATAAAFVSWRERQALQDPVREDLARTARFAQA